MVHERIAKGPHPKGGTPAERNPHSPLSPKPLTGVIDLTVFNRYLEGTSISKGAMDRLREISTTPPAIAAPTLSVPEQVGKQKKDPAV
jgi:hypothetical protein